MILPCSNRTFKASIVVIVLLFSQAQAQRPDFKLREWQLNKFWWWSSDAPITNALDQYPEVVRDTKKVVDHIERVEAGILSALRSREPPKKDVLFQPCRSPDRTKWPIAVTSNFGVRGFPDPDLSCVTDFTGVQFSRSEKAPYTTEELYSAIFRFALSVERHARSVIAPVIDVKKNFTGPSHPFNFPFKTPRAQCVLHPINAVRVGGKWRTSVIIQNRPLHEFMPLDGRQVLVEFFRVVDGHLGDNALMRLPVRPNNGTERKVREDATTILISARGNATPSTFRNIPIDENPAIMEALDMASVSLDQAQDAIGPSNIAILVLPLILNLFPVAAFSDVSGIEMLLYVLLGDVLTVIPLLIKGVELILIRQKHNMSVVTRMSSSVGGVVSEAAAAEIFAADCQAHEEVRIIGVIYVSLSIALLLVGIILEIAAKRYKKSRQKRHLMHLIWSRIDFPASRGTDEKSLMPSVSLESDAVCEALHKYGLKRSNSNSSYSHYCYDEESRNSKENPLKKFLRIIPR